LVKGNTTINISEAQITQITRNICCTYTGYDLQLTLAQKVLPDDWGRNLVWRYRVQNAPANFPQTVIAKASKLGGGHIFNEWASLQFLNQFAALNTLIPAFYGADKELELLVLEDLGAVRGQYDLGTILEGEDAALARAALLEHARQMALLHSATTGHEDAFNDIRSQFPTYNQPLSKDQFADNFNWFLQILPQFNLPTSPALEHEIQEVITRLQNHKAYTRGDVCPSNIAYHNQQIRFYDFEMGAYRSIFLSAAYFRISHLSCLNGSLIPLELQAEAEKIYFQTLTPFLPDLIVYQADYAAAAAAMLIWILSIYLEKKDRSRHLATLRQRVFAALTLYIQHPFFTAPFPHTAEILIRLHQKLDARWTEAEKTILPFPAFQVA
jgi:hypothetical protein